MPAPIVHLGATVTCFHAGQATPTAPFPRVLVSGQPVATIAAPYVIAACPFLTPGGNPLPCVTGNWTVGSLRVLASGQPLVLQTSTALCVPNGTGMIVSTAQPRVLAT